MAEEFRFVTLKDERVLLDYMISNYGKVIKAQSGKILKCPTVKKNNNYVMINLMVDKKQKIFYVHHLVYNTFKDYDKNLNIDHIDNDVSNNHLSNLRLCTQKQNLLNRNKYKNCKSIYKGVYPIFKNRQACANGEQPNKYIAVCNKRYLGTFKTEEEAGRAFNESAIEQYGEYAKLNIIA